MKLQNMSYMLKVAEEKSITKAAAALFIAQPALSQCIKTVEKELGYSIFIRQSTGVTVTEEGRCFLEFARRVMAEQKNYEKRINDIRSNASREIRIGLTGTQGAYVLPYFLPQFQRKYPMVKVILTEGFSPMIQKMIVDGDIDVGIIHPPIDVEGLDVFELSHDDLVIVPREQSRYHQFIYYRDGDNKPYLNLKFLENEPVALSTPKQRSRKICDEIFRRAGITPLVIQESKSLAALDALAQVNYATVFLPAKQLSAGLKQRVHFYIDPKYAPDYPFYVAVAHNTYHSLMTEKLLAFLRTLIGTF